MWAFLPNRANWARWLGLILLLMAAAQIVFEGPRWQIYPAYGLACLFGFIFLFGLPVRSLFALPLGILTLISASLPAVFPIPHLPHPTGPYQVGTLTYEWMDASRPEIYTDDPNDRRALMVQIWYPAKPTPGAIPAAYIPDARALQPLAQLLHLPTFTLNHLTYARGNAIPSASVADAQPKYPVLIFSHGRGGYRQHNTWEIEELVSHGYIVAAIDHTYAASGVLFPDGRLVPMDARMTERGFINSVIPYLAQDASFVLNQLIAINRVDPNGILAGRLDTERVGIFGLSLGGSTSSQACHDDLRFKACVVMDVWMVGDVLRDGVKQPTLFLTRDAASMKQEGWTQADIDETLNTMQAVYEKLPGDGYFVQVPGVFHTDFSDAPLLSPLTRAIGLTGPIDPARAHAITSKYTLEFFDRYLSNKPAPLLDGKIDFPEVIFRKR